MAMTTEHTSKTYGHREEWAELLTEVDDWQRDAFFAWCDSGSEVTDGSGMPVVSEFLDAYAGEWDTFRDYAEELADDTGMLAEIPEWARPYFDMDAFARDLSVDHWTEDAPHGGVYVFRSN